MVAHELGHALGLEHSGLPADLMYFLWRASSPDSFTQNERTTVRLMLQRRPGNRYPDDDRRAFASSTAALTSVVID